MVDAKKVRENIARMTNKVSSVTSGRVQPHKHCRICFTPIKLSAEPRVCKNQECIDKNERDERNQKQMRIWMFIFFGIFAFGFVRPILFRLL